MTMGATFLSVQGDSGDTVTADLSGVADYTGATATASVWQPGGTVTPLTAAVTNATNDRGEVVGRCVVQLGAWLATAPAGSYLVEYAITFGNGAVLTWPAGAPDQLIVRADA